MNPVLPNINIPGVKISSFLYRNRNPDYLTQDQIIVALPNGYHIDVSWHPEHDPGGTYVIRVFWQYADNPRGQPVLTKDFNEMLSAVEQLASIFSQAQIPVSSTDSKETVVNA